MLVGQLIEKIAVVRNHEDGAGILAQVFLEPLQGFQVQMVGRLVQHQQVRLLHQQAGQVRAHHPAAAHLAQGPMEILFAETQAGENLFGLRLQLVAAQLVVAGVDVIVESISWCAAECSDSAALIFRLQVRDFRRDGHGQFQNRFLAGRRGFLRQMADADIFLQRDRAGVGGSAFGE